MTIVALCPSPGGRSELDLLGRAVWQRTLLSSRRLKGARTVWLGRQPPTDAGELPDLAEPTTLFSRRDTIVCLPAELPCLLPGSLERLVRAARRGPAAIYEPNRRQPAVVAAPASSFRSVLDGRGPFLLDEVARRFHAEPVLAGGDEELVRVDGVEAWSRACRVLRRRKVEDLLRRGVRMEDPESVRADPEVKVGAGALIAPWVLLEGDTRIGTRCVIGSFSHVVDSTLGSETVLLDHCFVRSSRIGKRAQIGPFAHLRPESVVGATSRVGNFVELKKTRLGDGAKAPHLSYVGDATIGKGANVGAGTITCNYDGRAKHQTVVGDGAFIGSDVQLVAPVRVGKGAYVAAGSCIVEDVPAHALAIARSRQVLKRGWAKHRPAKKARG